MKLVSEEGMRERKNKLVRQAATSTVFAVFNFFNLAQLIG
jgi:hypothetical protein